MEVVLGLLFLIILMVGTYFVLFTLCVERGWFRWSRQRRLSDIALPGPWRNRKWAHWFLLLTRILSFLYAIGIWAGAIFPSMSSPTDLFPFYTIWNYIMYTVFFGCTTIATLIYLRRHKWRFPEQAHSFDSDASDSVTGADEEFGALEDKRDSNMSMVGFIRATWIMFEICFSCVFLVDIVVWTILLPNMRSQNQEGQVVNFVSYNVHASNALFVVLEFLLNRMKFAGAHVLFPVGWAMIYMAWSWIYFDRTGDWVYFFVDTSQNSAPGWYFLMLVMHSAFFGMGYGLWYLKERKLILRQKLAIRNSYDSHTSFSGSSSSSSLLPGGGRA